LVEAREALWSFSRLVQGQNSGSMRLERPQIRLVGGFGDPYRILVLLWLNYQYLPLRGLGFAGEPLYLERTILELFWQPIG
jgi:hypothetical protein